MIIFLAEGRLGNQIFQYVFLKTIQRKNEKIIVSGFDELLNVFDLSDESIIILSKKNKWIRGVVYIIFNPLLNKIADLGIISSIQVKYEKILDKYKRETTKYTRKKGLFKNVTFVKLAYFQSESFFNEKNANNLKIKDKFTLKADTFLATIPKDAHKVFIHIRLGDFANYTVYGKSTLLPMSYYKDQITWFIENTQNPFFIFLSDEPKLIEKEFNYLHNKVISQNSYEVDFAIMTLCNGGILSPSSFGWWGSYLMKDRDIVFAPKYWLGFNSGISYHQFPLFVGIKEIEL